MTKKYLIALRETYRKALENKPAILFANIESGRVKKHHFQKIEQYLHNQFKTQITTSGLQTAICKTNLTANLKLAPNTVWRYYEVLIWKALNSYLGATDD